MSRINKNAVIRGIYLLPLLFLLTSDFVFAALPFNPSDTGTISILNAGTGINSVFDSKLTELGLAFLTAAKWAVVIMTATAAIMIGLGIEDGKKTLWNWILGFGLAINFGWLLISTGLYSYAINQVPSAPAIDFPMPTLETGDGALKDGAENTDILSNFMKHYLDGVIKPGAEAIMPSCLKLLLIVTVIEATWELAFSLTSGDKVKYIVSMMLKCGFFMFLMTHWIEYMDALSNGFQAIGFTAGGTNLEAGQELKPDSIWKNAFNLFSIWKSESSAFQLGSFIVTGIGMIGTLIVAVLTAFEMFMARIEFFTMALLTIPLLPFAVTSKFGFLADKAIAAMINLSIKLCVIAFITAMSVPFFKGFMENAGKTDKLGENVAVILQCLLATLLIYLMIKKIPDLVSGLLNGQPSISGSNMMDMVKTAARTGVEVGKAVASGGSSVAGAVGGATAGTIGGAVAGAKSKGIVGGLTGGLGSLAKSATRGVMDMASPIAKPIGQAAKSVKENSTRQFKRYNGAQSLKNIVTDPGGFKNGMKPK